MNSEESKKKESGKKRREWLKSKGICTQCGQRDAVGSFVRCQECLYKQKQYRDRHREKHGIPDQREAMKKRRENLIQSGKCVQCAKRNSYRANLCPECWAKAKAARPKYYKKTFEKQRWSEEGLCKACGADREKGFKVCGRCLESIKKGAEKRGKRNEFWAKENSLIFRKRRAEDEG